MRDSGKYIGRALTLFLDEKHPFVVLRAADHVIERAIWVAEVLKRKVGGLHQVTRLSEQRIVDVYAPREEGLVEVQVERFLTLIEITLTKEPTAAHKAEPGYQPPVKVDEAELLTPEKWEEDKKRRAERRERRERDEHDDRRPERRERREGEGDRRDDRRDNRRDDRRDDRDRREGDRERPERREGGERRRGGRTEN